MIALPLTATTALLFVTFPQNPIPVSAWLGFAYAMLVSQLIGFFTWYYGLSLGGIARVSQTQLMQLFFTLAASAWLLGETVDRHLVIYGMAVATAVAIGARARIARTMASSPQA